MKNIRSSGYKVWHLIVVPDATMEMQSQAIEYLALAARTKAALVNDYPGCEVIAKGIEVSSDPISKLPFQDEFTIIFTLKPMTGIRPKLQCLFSSKTWH